MMEGKKKDTETIKIHKKEENKVVENRQTLGET